jgi:hypothetical protein
LERLDVGRTSTDIRTNLPLAQAHRYLRNDQTLTFDKLSWPADDQLSGQAGEAYRGSAQLFVTELLQLKNGRSCLRAMLEQLPAHLNWQIPFLDAFQASFPNSLAVEKWWALRLAHFTSRDIVQTWPLAESLQKLDQALMSPIQVRTGPNELPLRSEASLQTVVREWDKARQVETLKNKVNELDFLRLRVSREVAGLVEDYRQTLLAWLQSPPPSPSVYSHGEKGPAGSGNITLKRLQALDAVREELRRSLEPVATAQAQAKAPAELKAQELFAPR